MKPSPAIFSVLAFRSTEDGRIECRSHLVAACDDQEAERVIVESSREHLVGARCFVQTTENNQIHHAPAVQLYVDARRSELMSEQEFAGWVKSSTRKSCDGSESYPATFREFAVASECSRRSGSVIVGQPAPIYANGHLVHQSTD